MVVTTQNETVQVIIARELRDGAATTSPSFDDVSKSIDEHFGVLSEPVEAKEAPATPK